MSIKFIIFLVFFIIFWCSVISFIVWVYFNGDGNTDTTINKKCNTDDNSGVPKSVINFSNPMDMGSVYGRETYRMINEVTRKSH